MLKKLPKLSIVVVFLLSLSVLAASALAQAPKSQRQSRLDIGKKPKAVFASKSTVQFPLKTSLKLGEIRYKQPNAINQYFRSQLLSPTSTQKVSISSKSNENITLETVKHDVFEKGEKLFANEKIIVSAAYPNPASETTTIDYLIANNATDAKVLIYSMFATQVGEYVLDRNSKSIIIPTDALPSSVYYYQLVVDGKMVTQKKLLIRH